jgi:peptidoglycan/xylan/chitin deacetylase (PgdA/CDA1 family)
MRIVVFVWLVVASLWADAHIFVYHRFGDSRYPSANTSIDVLKKQFDYFKTHGYRVVPLSKLVAALKKGGPIPDDWVVLTIDDGYKSFYENGLSLFKKYGYPFTLFVYVKATEQHWGDYMTWDQINEVKRYGELGFHSYAHPHMVSKPAAALKKDFEKGLALMQKRTGEKPLYFAYPYGEYDDRVEAIAGQYGFVAVCRQDLGAVSQGVDPMRLDRIALTGNPNLESKLRVRHLAARWAVPKSWPADGVVGVVDVRVAPREAPAGRARAWLYLTGYGWREVPMRDGHVRVRLDEPLTKRRSRLILKTKDDKISTKLLVKP